VRPFGVVTTAECSNFSRDFDRMGGVSYDTRDIGFLPQL
jgi:hypothetical protein